MLQEVIWLEHRAHNLLSYVNQADGAWEVHSNERECTHVDESGTSTPLLETMVIVDYIRLDVYTHTVIRGVCALLVPICTSPISTLYLVRL